MVLITLMPTLQRYKCYKGVSIYYLFFINYQGYLKGKAFIATQGPLPDTTDDFWRMVWEHKCASIIMLANEREGSKVSELFVLC